MLSRFAVKQGNNGKSTLQAVGFHADADKSALS